MQLCPFLSFHLCLVGIQGTQLPFYCWMDGVRVLARDTRRTAAFGCLNLIQLTRANTEFAALTICTTICHSSERGRHPPRLGRWCHIFCLSNCWPLARGCREALGYLSSGMEKVALAMLWGNQMVLGNFEFLPILFSSSVSLCWVLCWSPHRLSSHLCHFPSSPATKQCFGHADLVLDTAMLQCCGFSQLMGVWGVKLSSRGVSTEHHHFPTLASPEEVPAVSSQVPSCTFGDVWRNQRETGGDSDGLIRGLENTS